MSIRYILLKFRSSTWGLKYLLNSAIYTAVFFSCTIALASENHSFEHGFAQLLGLGRKRNLLQFSLFIAPVILISYVRGAESEKNTQVQKNIVSRIPSLKQWFVWNHIFMLLETIAYVVGFCVLSYIIVSSNYLSYSNVFIFTLFYHLFFKLLLASLAQNFLHTITRNILTSLLCPIVVGTIVWFISLPTNHLEVGLLTFALFSLIVLIVIGSWHIGSKKYFSLGDSNDAE